jgi:hypothetical protein
MVVGRVIRRNARVRRQMEQVVAERVCAILGVDTRENAKLERIARERVAAFGFYLRGLIEAEASRIPRCCLRPKGGGTC